MKRYCFMIFTMIFTAVLVISIVRTGMNKSPLDIRKTWHYITSSSIDGSIESINNNLSAWQDTFNNLSWNYQAIDDAAFFAQVGNFFVNVGNFFYNIGIAFGVGIMFIVKILVYFVNLLVWLVKITAYLLT